MEFRIKIDGRFYILEVFHPEYPRGWKEIAHGIETRTRAKQLAKEYVWPPTPSNVVEKFHVGNYGEMFSP